MRLAPYVKHRIRSAWERHETNTLRQKRLLVQAGPNAVTVGAYQVVKVLGKLQSRSKLLDCL